MNEKSALLGKQKTRIAFAMGDARHGQKLDLVGFTLVCSWTTTPTSPGFRPISGNRFLTTTCECSVNIDSHSPAGR